MSGSERHHRIMSNDTTTTTNTNTTTGERTVPAEPGIDPRPLFANAVSLCRDVIAGVRPEQFDAATPCTEFDVRTLTAHLVAVLKRVAVVGAGGDPFSVAQYMTGVADTDWLSAYDGSAAEAEAVWSDDAVLTKLVTVPWAQLPGFVAMLIYINEVTVHTWDLAAATGQQPAWSDAVLTTAYEAIHRGLPAEGRADAPFGEVVPVADDAPLIDRIVAWNGRRP